MDVLRQGIDEDIRISKERFITAASNSFGNIRTNRKIPKSRKQK